MLAVLAVMTVLAATGAPEAVLPQRPGLSRKSFFSLPAGSRCEIYDDF